MSIFSKKMVFDKSKVLQNRYFRINYEDESLLRKFAFNIGCRTNNPTLNDNIIERVTYLLENTEYTLDMFPDNYYVEICLLNNIKDINNKYDKTHKDRKIDLKGYFSLSEKTIYISVCEVNERILIHEIAHSIIDAFFTIIRPPYKIHEVIAQFAEKNTKG